MLTPQVLCNQTQQYEKLNEYPNGINDNLTNGRRNQSSDLVERTLHDIVPSKNNQGRKNFGEYPCMLLLCVLFSE